MRRLEAAFHYRSHPLGRQGGVLCTKPIPFSDHLRSRSRRPATLPSRFGCHEEGDERNMKENGMPMVVGSRAADRWRRAMLIALSVMLLARYREDRAAVLGHLGAEHAGHDVRRKQHVDREAGCAAQRLHQRPVKAVDVVHWEDGRRSGRTDDVECVTEIRCLSFSARRGIRSSGARSPIERQRHLARTQILADSSRSHSSNCLTPIIRIGFKSVASPVVEGASEEIERLAELEVQSVSVNA